MKRIISNNIYTSSHIRRRFAALVAGSLLSISLLASDRGEEVMLERWMSTPFITEMNATGDWIETGNCLESWMKVPFGNEMVNGFQEESAVLESWMTVPFGNDILEDPTVLEMWMTVPFNNGFSEEDPRS